MLVTIVTPSYNQAEFLEKTIESVLCQDYPHIEYMVIDGGSTDGSVDIIRRYADRLKWWVSEKDYGQTDAINKGFSRAEGEILAWLNSDDTYQPGAVSAAVAALEKNPKAAMVYGDSNFIDQNGKVIGRFAARQTDFHKLREGYVHIPQQAAFFLTKYWQKVAPLDPTFYFAMDYDLWVRLSSQAPIVYIPELWANFRMHGDAKTITADNRCWPEMLRVHRRLGGSNFSIIFAKYLLRRVAAPYLRWRRRLLIAKHPNTGSD